TVTTGAEWSSLTTTRSPLGSFRYTTGTENFVLSALWAEGAPAASTSRQQAPSTLRIECDFSIRFSDKRDVETVRVHSCGRAFLHSCVTPRRGGYRGRRVWS